MYVFVGTIRTQFHMRSPELIHDTTVGYPNTPSTGCQFATRGLAALNTNYIRRGRANHTISFPTVHSDDEDEGTSRQTTVEFDLFAPLNDKLWALTLKRPNQVFIGRHGQENFIRISVVWWPNSIQGAATKKDSKCCVFLTLHFFARFFARKWPAGSVLASINAGETVPPKKRVEKKTCFGKHCFRKN